MSSVNANGDRIVLVSDGDIRSANVGKILLDCWRILNDERRSLILYNEDVDDEDEIEFISQFKSSVGTCLLSLLIERIH